ncbi:hypothetical protein LMG24238_06877 [Paraburkholderia sediminicola]|uniref:Lipoprotein n=1 Tax=Paraburkholderia sediminicola TaxID=458836 RepID=A0A6J5CS18_9BURK|nr:hypothetical protein [Paraburkholderia sediminicola]CAB3742397.1 hypothetical protein LMG24238_06877 [Paraburkholderia sediminicola]
MIRATLVALLCASTSGCASLWYAGMARYDIEPITNANGVATSCCVLKVWNGKQMATVDATFTRSAAGDYSISLRETDVQAFQGQATAAAAASDVAAAAASAAVTAIKTFK